MQNTKEFKYNEDGRRYHGQDDVTYMLPIDDDEADRLHGQHWALKSALGRNYHAHVTKLLEEGITVLDLGCGPATWTFEMAKTYSRSEFYGIDVSFVFPELIKSANVVELVMGNITKEISFPDNTIDNIHQRLLILALNSYMWESALKELYRVLKPGGYIELAEIDLQNSVKTGPNLQKVQAMTRGMLATRGYPEDIYDQLEGRFVKAGFVNQVCQIIPIALNHSGKTTLLWEDLGHSTNNTRPALAKITQEWEDLDEYNRFMDRCAAEATENKTDMNFYACYAQKPLI